MPESIRLALIAKINANKVAPRHVKHYTRDEKFNKALAAVQMKKAA